MHHCPTEPLRVIIDATVAVTVSGVRAGSSIGVAVARLLRPFGALAARPPFVPRHHRPAHLLKVLADTGRAHRQGAALAALRCFHEFVPVLATEILDQLDLTALIRDRVEWDTLAIGIVSIGSHTAGVTQQSRIQSVEEEQAIAAWVERVFRPGRPSPTEQGVGGARTGPELRPKRGQGTSQD